MKSLKALADSTSPDSLGSKLRKKRFKLFLKLIEKFSKPVSILDIGGTQSYWAQTGLTDNADYQITIINTEEQKVTSPNITFIKADGTDLPVFKDKQFDIVHSNSVIEHLRTFEEQKKMANEIMRTGKSYYVQTPNYWFPFEPHFLFPMFQYLPKSIRVFMLTHINLGWYPKTKDKNKAKEIIASINLLTYSKFKSLFPSAKIVKEKYSGLTKSFMAYR